MESEKGLEAFRSDLGEVQSRRINRFPTLLFRKANQPTLSVSGYRPYAVLLEVMKQIAPDIKRIKAIDKTEYINYWGSLTDRELQEIAEEKN